MRVLVFAVATWLTLHLLKGSNAARIALTVLLSVLGLASLLIGPIQWLMAGQAPLEALRNLTLPAALFGVSRVVHVLAVLAATGSCTSRR